MDNSMIVRPQGWLKKFLLAQMDGLIGHIEVSGYPYNTRFGGTDLVGEGNPWWSYEQTGYWIDGFTRCAILLQDKPAIKKAEEIIYSVINKPDKSGYCAFFA